MTAPRVEILAKSRAAVYLRRAENLLKVMDVADTAGNPDAIATNAIQAGIALGDAFTVSMLQRRSRGQDHGEVVLLIRQCSCPATSEIAKLIQQILNRRTAILYASEEVTLRDARELARFARKLHSVVRTALASSGAASSR